MIGRVIRRLPSSVVLAAAVGALVFTSGAAALGSYREEVLADSPRGYWRVAETAGTAAQDETANNNDGTYTGGVGLGAAGALSSDSANASASFDGVNDLVTMGDPATGVFDFGTGDFSIEVWVKTAVNGERVVASKYASGSPDWRLSVTDDSGRVGDLRFQIETGGSTRTHYSTARVDDNAWHQVVVLVDRGVAVSFYIDKVLRGSSVDTNTASIDNSGPLQWGDVSGGANFQGSLDEPTLYGTLLSAERIAAHYDAAQGPPPSAECNDGADNDGDGAIDYPADLGCASSSDSTEAPNPQCSNSADDDADTRTDLADPGCSSGADDSELGPEACNDGVDNDSDGRTDSVDPGCSGPLDTSEAGPEQCNDGVDNDNDGRVDHPTDAGCSSAVDPSEAGPEQCNDQVDNDADGSTDYPADPDCASALDNDESTAPANDCTHFVATNGNDGNAGTEASPWLTVQKALDALQPGQVACVKAGTYARNLIYNRPLASFITIKAFPGDVVVLRPAAASPSHPLRIDELGSHLRVEGFTFTSDGTTAPASGGLVDSYGSFIEIIGNEITASADNGVYTDEESDHNSMLRNWIHDNGVVLDGNQDHGIYLQGDDHLVANNVIHDNRQGFGIQHYDYGRRARIINNTITHNGTARPCCGGIVLGGGAMGPEGSGVADAVVANNVVAYNQNSGISRDSTSPASCSIHDNLAFGQTTNYGSNFPAGCLGVDNAVGDPLFLSVATRDLHVDDGSPAIDTGSTADAVSPDRDGIVRPQGNGPDKGAYER
jgi:hypothetical protein